jgi:hypothetical protein
MGTDNSSFHRYGEGFAVVTDLEALVGRPDSRAANELDEALLPFSNSK